MWWWWLPLPSLGGWFYLSQQDEKASVELGQAVRTMEAPLRAAGTPAAADSPSFTSAKERVTEAHKQFQAVVDKYPHTHSSDVARYFVGVTAADVGDNAGAERELKSVASSGNDDLAGLAQMSLASLYRNTNRSKDAIEIYKKLIDKPAQSVGKVRAQLELAATYESQQLPLEAKSIYQQVAERQSLESGSADRV